MKPTVLIVDDSLTVRMDLAEAFEHGGFEPILAATIADARRELAARTPPVVVLDVMLPDGDGVDLLRELRARDTAIAILMLSTEAELADRVRALQTGADDYVGKPYDRSYVVAKARELVRVRRGSPSVTRVLVIDDSLTFREALRAALERAGYSTLVAETGEDGLRIATAQRPSAIVVDGQLPGIDGAAVIRHVRLDAALRGTPCLLLTASEDRDIELRALDAGADAFARKSDDFELILARVAAVLRSASARDATVSSLGARKILAIADSVQHELATALRGEGYDVVLARSGEEGIEALAVEAVDCILVDVEMPGLSGHETCRRIKAAPGVRDIPLVMLAEHDDRAAMLEGLAAGADDFIAKASDFAVLKARVRAQLRRKQLEDESRLIREQVLRAAHAEALEEKNRELEAFSYSVSHDLRAPLRAIDGFASALVEDYGPQLDATARQYLQRITSSVHRMSELIEDLLRLARVARVELAVQRCDLGAIAREELAHVVARDPQRVVETHVQPDLVADADPGLLRAVFQNLIGNAWKFTKTANPARIEIGAALRDGRRAFFVRDNGIGFDAAHAEKLFRPFFRLHSEKEYEGTGIGLSTVQRIIARHAGQIWAEGSVGAGATIYFTLGEP